MNPSTCPPHFLCSLSGVVMTTPVTLTATGQSFELSVLSKALRKNPLIDPITGARISSNAMEIDFQLQSQIEDYDEAQSELNIDNILLNLNEKECIQKESDTTSPTAPTAPPIDFALSFMNDDSSDDDDSGHERAGRMFPNQLREGPPPGFECTHNAEDANFPITLKQGEVAANDASASEETELEIKNVNHESDHLPPKQETLPTPSCISSPQEERLLCEKVPKSSEPLFSSGAPSFPQAIAHPEQSFEQEDLSLFPHRSHAYEQRPSCSRSHKHPACDFSRLESVSFAGPPSHWNYSRGNADIVGFLLQRDNNEYADRKLLSNTSTISKRAKALCRRFPVMWGFETDLKGSSQTIVSLMNSMNKSDDDLAEDNPTDRPARNSLGPLGPAGPPGMRNRVANTNGARGSSANQMHREGGNTALHVAVWNGHMNVVTCLVEAGASLDTKNANNCTPLMLGCRFGHFEIAKYLLEHGSPFRMIRKDDICSQGKVDDFQAKKQIIALLNSYRRKAGLSYLR